MKNRIGFASFVSTVSTAAVIACTGLFASAPAVGADLAVREIGSFYIGGEEMRVSGQPIKEVSTTAGMPPAKRDPNGEFEIGQMYVQFTKLAHPKAKYPILLLHGGGLSGTTYETKPDGQPGWQQYFLAAGYDVYVPDAVERGRSSWSPFYDGAPVLRPKREIWELFRFGPEGSYDPSPEKRVAYPGVQFPVALLDDFAKQMMPRWTTNDVRTQKAYDALVDKVCPCYIVVHSQGGNFGYTAAMHNPGKVKGLVLLEPSGAPNPATADKNSAAKVPHVAVWGDNIQKGKVWPNYQKASIQWRDAVKGAGGSFDWIELPTLGIFGNTHMMMMDKNSDQIAGIVQDWLSKHGSMLP
jgi:pimeloyl-ACP methyl ester carboxylesterase